MLTGADTSFFSELRQGAIQRLRLIEELWRARREVDMPGVVAGIRARLEARLQLTALPVADDLLLKTGPLGFGQLRTFAWHTPEARKVVLSQIAVPPIVEGFALVIHPSPRRAAPIFGADLMALPFGLSVNAEVYGEPARTRDVLESLGESFGRLRSQPGPEWAGALAGGHGLHARPSPRLVDDTVAVLAAALGQYLDCLLAAPQSDEVARPSPSERTFFQAFHEHGPRRGAVARLFGAQWAERYSRLIFE